ncbi:CsbD family protein [Amycolatopsis sp. A133]|uniref:CsbD family protein n=1 Tax=Amycolatopsis sp. A133 TaxID=3064472 RepID=UPI0027EA0C55|nr:CsbD family protein [Amycolatopsis sp. A133]MDQ7806659.1 CsbD family protein [Amycolatopsis sp. A133]
MTMKHKIQQVVGSARERAGAATGNRRLEASGRTQRRSAQIRSAASDIRLRARRVAREAQVKLGSGRATDPR